MFYKCTSEIVKEHFGRPEYSPMIFEYEQPLVSVSIKNEVKEGANFVTIEALISKEPKNKIEEVFRKLQEGFYSNEENIKELVESLKNRLHGDDANRFRYTLPYDILPDYFRSYCDEITSTLLSFSSKTYKTIRWMQNIEGSNKPFKNTKLEWSFDAQKWTNFPDQISGELSIKVGLYSSPKFIELVKGFVQSGESEPLGHELLREAGSIKSNYPKSALLIAVSAAETAIKKCITFFKPETCWLIENTASPDIIKLYRDYIHAEILKDTKYKSLNLPNETILKPLRNIIYMRNIIAHGGVCNINGDKVSDYLHTIKNLLWLIDLFLGYEWAVDNIDDEIKLELGL